MMLIQHIALVSEDNGPSPSELARVAAALQEQVMRDLAPLWDVSATVHAFPFLEDVPLGVWPIVITGKPLGAQSGIHRDDNGQPYAHIATGDAWSLRASRVCLEMLVNPTEDRLVAAASPRNPGELAEYLVEVCGPSDPRRAYSIQGVMVSDFCTPAYYGMRFSWGHGYSVNGSADAPLQLPRYGHLTWRDLASNTWWLRNHWTEQPIDTRLGVIDKRVVSVREFVQACAEGFDLPSELHPEARAERHVHAARSRAHRLRSFPAPKLDSDWQRVLLDMKYRQAQAAAAETRRGEPFAEHLRSAVDISQEAFMLEDTGTTFARPRHGFDPRRQAPSYTVEPQRRQTPLPPKPMRALPTPQPQPRPRSERISITPYMHGAASLSLRLRNTRGGTLLVGGAVAGGLAVLAISALGASGIVPRTLSKVQAALDVGEPESPALPPQPMAAAIAPSPARTAKAHPKLQPAREMPAAPAKPVAPPTSHAPTLEDEIISLIETRQ